jgi:hypothetical protein
MAKQPSIKRGSNDEQASSAKKPRGGNEGGARGALKVPAAPGNEAVNDIAGLGGFQPDGSMVIDLTAEDTAVFERCGVSWGSPWVRLSTELVFSRSHGVCMCHPAPGTLTRRASSSTSRWGTRRRTSGAAGRCRPGANTAYGLSTGAVRSCTCAWGARGAPHGRETSSPPPHASASRCVGGEGTAWARVAWHARSNPRMHKM